MANLFTIWRKIHSLLGGGNGNSVNKTHINASGLTDNGTTDTNYSLQFEDGRFTYNENGIKFTQSNLIDAEKKGSLLLRFDGEDSEEDYHNINAGKYSVVLGSSNSNLGKRTLIIGKFNTSGSNAILNELEESKYGSNNLVSGLRNTVNCNSSITSGNSNKNFSNTSFVQGYKNVCGAIIGDSYDGATQDSTKESNYIGCLGAYNIVTGQSTLVVGNNITSSAEYSLVSGRSHIVAGTGSIVGGLSNIDQSSNSIVVGQNNTNAGDLSILAGKNNNIDDKSKYSLIVGQNNYNKNNAFCSIVTGGSNCNQGPNSIVVGERVTNNQSNSFTFGYNITNTKNNNALIFGKYNEDKSNLLLGIGNGYKDNPNNAFEIDSDGCVGIKSIRHIDDETFTRHPNSIVQLDNNGNLTFTDKNNYATKTSINSLVKDIDSYHGNTNIVGVKLLFESDQGNVSCYANLPLNFIREMDVNLSNDYIKQNYKLFNYFAGSTIEFSNSTSGYGCGIILSNYSYSDGDVTNSILYNANLDNGFKVRVYCFNKNVDYITFTKLVGRNIIPELNYYSFSSTSVS